ncbi:MAG: ROK family protein [Phycisphaerales bacterium]|nr:ROK family protein [Phycisphaerales bacterium]
MRTGVDLGGTKIEAVVVDDTGRVVVKQRIATPKGKYDATVASIASLVEAVEAKAGGGGDVLGIGVPGSPSPSTGLMRNCNSTALNGKRLGEDLQRAIGREVRMANDANCMALSEAFDGAGAGASSVFGIILGTGVGGGVVVENNLVVGANGVAGEWGHIPLPWPRSDELQCQPCWCGRHGCLETWLSGPAIETQWIQAGGQAMKATEIARLHPDSQFMQRWIDRLARATALVINMLDPEVIVVGGGLNAISAIYHDVPARWPDFVFSDAITTKLVPAMHGDSSGVLGAARL